MCLFYEKGIELQTYNSYSVCFYLTFQDCVQLNQYTLKDEIGKVNSPGTRLVFYIYQECLSYSGGNPLELGVGRSPWRRDCEGGFCHQRSIWFIFFLLHNINVFPQKLRQLRGNSISPILVFFFFLSKVLSHLFLLLFQPMGSIIAGVKNSNANRKQVSDINEQSMLGLRQ